MSTVVIYRGPTSRSDLSTEFHVPDESDKMHVLYVDQETEVPDALGKELLDGSERTKGHEFESAKNAASGGNS